MAGCRPSVRFHCLATDPTTRARAGWLETPHGPIPTPVFMPVGTQGTVKGLTPRDLAAHGVQIVLANTYHLLLRPGPAVVAALGGLHRFMGWSGPILTDSGGFQVLSLATRCALDDNGVTFRSHLDGTLHRLTPEGAMAIQAALGSDIAMALDECPPYPADRLTVARAVERTQRWAERCRAAWRRPDQALFGIVQGGVYPDLRRQSVRGLVALDLPGYAIGGLSVGEPKSLTYAVLADVTAELPADRPRYLMGVGAPEDLVVGVALGVDMFDCVLPTRLGRHGTVFTPEGRQDLRRGRWRKVADPIDPACDCLACRRFSAGYLHHLFRSQEPLGPVLASLHNLRFLVRCLAEARAAIIAGRFRTFAQTFLERAGQNVAAALF